MSRIGNNPISIPEGVSVEVNGDIITVKGQKGEMNQTFDGVSFDVSSDTLIVKRNSESKDHKSKHGLYRSLVSNMVTGVNEGFTLELELVGVGYRAASSGQKLDLALGYSHTIVMNIAPEVKVECVNEKGSNPIIKLSSSDKQLVGHVAAKIRSFRRPEPYKGKGIKFIFSLSTSSICFFSLICLILSIISVTSSTIPSIVENSWSTPSIFIEVKA